jgi:hypothetical protein
MSKEKPIVDTPGDREKLEETVKAAEDMIALLKQFRVPISNNTIRAVNKARKYLNKTKSSKKTVSM